MKTLKTALLFLLLLLWGCNTTEQPYEVRLTAEQEKIIDDFRQILRKNQLKADSISYVTNQNYRYKIPIKAYLDKQYRRNDIWFDYESFIIDVPYYGMCNGDTTQAFIFSLHHPDNIINVRLYSFINEHIAYDSKYDYEIKFK